ncbi:type II toxin-antitoxin system prevent-host-death family antitoxin [Ignavigranum ruoffiae]|uniref:type II toxin-antitoxin system prevent-host-death family antitoxin n=1 Tax=Ignavigranum ruoffiae TaxID=89093 RepID=UPI00205FB8AE|nr:type II toxin-antitoxin system prevent-host-death family antitoxin [Ignavigranum ruoffiae]UPQ85050.1 type II toxin-antitoxin system prevent-host-death family antitoxin [Ignavigranum ruoffiae]
MPRIQSSTDLRNSYNEISSFCNQSHEPVFITKNGRGDLAVMSIKSYENLVGKKELYHLLEESMEDIDYHRTQPLNMVIEKLKQDLKND